MRLGQLLPAIGIELDGVVRNIRTMEQLYWEKAASTGDPSMQTLDAIVQILEQLSICCTAAGRDATNVEVTEDCIAVLSLGRLRRALSGGGEPVYRRHPAEIPPEMSSFSDGRQVGRRAASGVERIMERCFCRPPIRRSTSSGLNTTPTGPYAGCWKASIDPSVNASIWRAQFVA